MLGNLRAILKFVSSNRAMAYILGLDRYTPAKWAVRILAHAVPEQGGADDLFASAERGGRRRGKWWRQRRCPRVVRAVFFGALGLRDNIEEAPKIGISRPAN